MLLTNTTQADFVNFTAVNGTVICGVALRGCSACPAHFADQESEHRGSKRLERRGLRPGNLPDAIYRGSLGLWQQPWLDMSAISRPVAMRLGSFSGRSRS